MSSAAQSIPATSAPDEGRRDERTAERLDRQLAFVREIDRLKTIVRRTSLHDASRLENSAEHSWHLATMALVLGEHAPEGADVLHAVRLLLVHDIVEIDAGDTFAYDTAGHVDKDARERAAAARIFGILPDDQGDALRALWEEFEAGETPTARFANALDRLQPLLANLANGGGSWHAAGVTRAAVRRRMGPIEQGCPTLWPWVCAAIDRAHAEGLIRPDPT
jgi:putative hydrolase of HD superfamily